MVPPLLPRYRFTRTEACLMWAHVEAGIELEVVPVAGTDDRVDVGVTVWHGCDPFGARQEWVWRESLSVRGTVRAGASAGSVQIVLDDPSITAALSFDPSTAEHDTVWGLDDARLDRVTPPLDFWSPLFAWGWARQARAWSRTLAQAELDACAAKDRELPRVDELSTEWGARWLADVLRFWDDGRFSVRRGLGYALEAGAHCARRAASAGRWVIVLAAFAPARIADLLAAGPPTGATPEQRDDWYRHHAGRRPEYALGWLGDAAEADRWVAHVDAALLAARTSRSVRPAP